MTPQRPHYRGGGYGRYYMLSRLSMGGCGQVIGAVVLLLLIGLIRFFTFVPRLLVVVGLPVVSVFLIHAGIVAYRKKKYGEMLLTGIILVTLLGLCWYFIPADAIFSQP